MNKKSKIIASTILTLFLLLAGVQVAIASIGGSTNTLYVNGVKIAKSEGQPVVRTGTLFVPVEPVIKGMGDKFTWLDEPTSVLIKKKDSTEISIYLGRSAAIVNGKAVPISTKVVNTVTVPVPIKPTAISGKLYVPVEFLKEVMGYSVDVKTAGNSKFVIVGKAPAALEPVEDTPVPTTTPTPEHTPSEAWTPDLGYLPPSGWTPPQIRSSSTDDFQKDKAILEEELGFLKGYLYNIHGTTNMWVGNKIMIRTHTEYFVDIQFLAWYGDKTGESDANKIPYISRELFKFYLADKGETLLSIIQDGVDGKDISKYYKPFSLNGREIKIVNGEGSFDIQIGYKK